MYNKYLSKKKKSSHWSHAIKISFPLNFSVQSVPQSPQRLPSIPPRALRSTSPAQTMALHDTTLGFQVDRVKKAESGEGKIKITAYYASTGKVRYKMF